MNVIIKQGDIFMGNEERNRSFFKEDTYETFRKFLKINFYYCTLSQKQQSEYVKYIGTTQYNHYRGIIERISEGKISFKKYNKKKAFKYDVSQFTSDYNVLANSFQLKTITASQTCLTIYILCVLAKSSLTRKGIVAAIADGIDEKTIVSRIKSMKEAGLISYDGEKYFIEESIFYSMDESLLLRLLNMVDFMKNLVYPEALGYNLFDIIKKIYDDRLCVDYYSPFQFKYSHLANILDDNVLWSLIEAIEERQYISFTYKNEKKERIIPVKLFTENEYARRYLFAVKKFGNNYKKFIFRLSEIYNIKVMEKEVSVSEEEFEKLLEMYETESGYSFSGKIAPSSKTVPIKLRYKGRLKNQIERDFSNVKFEKGNTAEILIKNKKMIIPYLRSNMQLIQSTDEELSQQVNSEIMEMKKLYGII